MWHVGRSLECEWGVQRSNKLGLGRKEDVDPVPLSNANEPDCSQITDHGIVLPEARCSQRDIGG